MLFIDTEMLPSVTLDYQLDVAALLGLTNLQVTHASGDNLFEHKDENLLHLHDPYECCTFRKTEPLQKTLHRVFCWISERKQYQGRGCLASDLLEVDRVLTRMARIRVNPLTQWDINYLIDFITKNILTRHPSVAKEFQSSDCAPL
ncbi:MAG: phosphoadenosine phosphosulfate reductase [Alteromonas macleodii]|jgi:phosphoadenosine phosphosulfate reductase